MPTFKFKSLPVTVKPTSTVRYGGRSYSKYTIAKRGRKSGRRGTNPKMAQTIRNLVQPAKQIRKLTTGTLNTSSAIALNTTHLVEHLTDIPQGVAIDDRTASSVFVKGVKITISVNNNGTKTRGGRLVVLSPHSAIGADITESTLPNIFTSSSFIAQSYDKLSGSLILPINKERYHVYFDKTIKLTPELLSGGNGLRKYWVPIKRTTLYDKIAGDPHYNKLWVIFMLGEYDNTTSVSTNLVNIYSTVYFRDGHKQFNYS